ncbi:MAG: Gfo/Idh/MocA family oxidoreductase [archaeon]
MKVGVIGAGYWGKKVVEEYTLLGIDTTVADLSTENLKYCADRYKVKTTKNYKDILDDKQIRYVNVCTPNETHYKLGKECLLNGKNVLIEKPLATKVEHCIELSEIAKEKKVLLVVGHIFRFNNALKKVKEMIDNKSLGDIEIIKLRWTNIERLFDDRDVILDLAPHCFDIINYLTGKIPTEISCIGSAYRREKGAEAVFINGRIDNTLINIELSWITPRKTRSVEVIGSKGSAFIDCTNQKIEIYESGGFKTLNIIPNNTIQSELMNFINCAETNTDSVASSEVGIIVQKLIKAAQDSLIEKKIIML